MEYCTLPLAIAFLILSIVGLRHLPQQLSNIPRSTTATICMAQTQQTDITIHVGPGYNRAIRLYMPPDQQFPVTGQSVAGDGTLWWKIEVPGVDEAWVAAQDVDNLGTCETVTDADVPPIVLAAPPAPTGDVVSFPVHNCVYLGSGEFEWYSADVTYQDGAVIEEIITGGPFRGQWQAMCLAGEQPSGEDSGPAPANPEQPPGPEPTNAPPPPPPPPGGGSNGQ